MTNFESLVMRKSSQQRHSPFFKETILVCRDFPKNLKNSSIHEFFEQIWDFLNEIKTSRGFWSALLSVWWHLNFDFRRSEPIALVLRQISFSRRAGAVVKRSLMKLDDGRVELFQEKLSQNSLTNALKNGKNLFAGALGRTWPKFSHV